jgi:hypothetical protein
MNGLVCVSVRVNEGGGRLARPAERLNLPVQLFLWGLAISLH